MCNSVIKEIIGLVPVAIIGEAGDDIITMKFSDGSSCEWFHKQDCCEPVSVYDVIGDWEDLIGNPILVAEVRVSDEGPESNGESDTWTFYTFRGIKGSVDVRWWGFSNGYYSESVDFLFRKSKSNKEI